MTNPMASTQIGSVERQKQHDAAARVIIGVIFLWNFFLTGCWSHFVTFLPSVPVISALLIWRVCLILNELPHFMETCSGSYLAVLKRTMSFNNASVMTGVFVTAVLMSKPFNEDTLKDTILQMVQIYGLLPLSLSFCACLLMFFVSRWEECVTWEANTMKCLDGLDYGSGIAHSYFHGYLKLILPAKGDNNKSIRKRIDDYIERESLTDDQFPVKKLVILIPRSGYSFPTFSDAPSQTSSDKDIEPVEALQDHLQDRAGTKRRVYRGGAYRIRITSGSKTSFLYTVAEGATPLQTFREACTSGSPRAERLRQHKVDITSNFCRTLQNLIDQDPECKDLTELIYYNDEDYSTTSDVVALLKQFLLKNCRALA